MLLELILGYINGFEWIFEYIAKKRRKNEVLNSPVRDTLEKVEIAQKHLTEAIEAIDIIRDQVLAERSQLDSLLGEVNKKKEEYNETSSVLEETRSHLKKDKKKLRRSLGLIPSPREKIIAFFGGVLASLVGAALWFISSKIWTWYTPLDLSAK